MLVGPKGQRCPIEICKNVIGRVMEFTRDPDRQLEEVKVVLN